VPGRKAALFIFDRLFTHFEREETVESLNGKLQDELLRIHRSLEAATSSSLFVLNEVFTSTTVLDALFLSRSIVEKIVELDALCVCVTFLDEIAEMGDTIVSLVGSVDPVDPSVRTFKIERRPADGLAYALSLAEKYGLTYKRLKERVSR
jgi:DNA mismatch repair ATPase MutS